MYHYIYQNHKVSQQDISYDLRLSRPTVTTNLAAMENDGLIVRKVYPQIPPRVEYTLSNVGYSLAPVLNAMASWGTDYKTFLELLKKRG